MRGGCGGRDGSISEGSAREGRKKAWQLKNSAVAEKAVALADGFAVAFKGKILPGKG